MNEQLWEGPTEIAIWAGGGQLWTVQGPIRLPVNGRSLVAVSWEDGLFDDETWRQHFRRDLSEK
jgi:hypothetical protein